MDLRSKQQHEFIGRHIGPNEAETTQMLQGNWHEFNK
jgi:hypothetical protein